MKRTLLAALTTLALVGCSHAKNNTASASNEGKDEQTESVAHSADERVQAQDSRQASDNSVYSGPSATGGSGSDVVTDPNTGAATPVDNSPTQGNHETQSNDGAGAAGTGGSSDSSAGNMATRTDGSGTGGSGDVQAKSEVKEEEGTGGSGSTTGSSTDSTTGAVSGSTTGSSTTGSSTTGSSTTGSSSMDSSMDATGGSGSTAGTGSMDTSTSTTTKTTKAAPCPDSSTKK